jgi:hypothetical protein
VRPRAPAYNAIEAAQVDLDAPVAPRMSCKHRAHHPTRRQRGTVRVTTREAAHWTTLFCISPLQSFLVRRGGSLLTSATAGQPRGQGDQAKQQGDRGETGTPEYAAYCKVATVRCRGGIPDMFRGRTAAAGPATPDPWLPVARNTPPDAIRRRLGRPEGMGVKWCPRRPEGSGAISGGMLPDARECQRRTSVTQPAVCTASRQ